MQLRVAQLTVAQLALLGAAAALIVGCGEIGGERRQAGGSIAGIAPTDLSSDSSGPPAYDSTPPSPQSVVTPAAPAASSGPPAPVSSKAPPAAAASSENGSSESAPGESPSANQPAPGMTREKAKQGATGKGNYGEAGLITTPISAYFHIQERLVYDVQIPHALDLYRATNDGRGPTSHDEFMRDIIKANQIQLPTLPLDHTYIFDPESQQLMVEHPAE